MPSINFPLSESFIFETASVIINGVSYDDRNEM